MSRLILRSSVSSGDGGDPGDGPQYVQDLDPFETLALTSVVNGVPHFFEAAGSAWQANPSIPSPPAGAGETQHLQAVTNFSGGVGDTLRGYLYAHGGGHADGAYNGLLRFNFNGTTQATGWTLATGSETVTPSDANSNVTYADGKPASIHSYDQMWLDETNNIFYRSGGSPWSQGGGATTRGYKFDFTSGTWSSIADQPTLFDLGACSVYDPISNKAYFCRQNNVSHFYRCGADTWSGNKTDFSGGGYSFGSGYDSLRKRIVVIGQSGEGAVVRKDIGTLDFTNETVAVSSFSPTGDSCPYFNTEGNGIAYDDLLDCFWVFGGKGQAFDTIYRINASTFAVTAHPLSAAIDVSSGEFFGLWKRFCFMSSWRMIGVAISYNQPCYVIKLPSA